MDHLRHLYHEAYTLHFAEWEKRALVPLDLYRTPAEIHSRYRVARVMRCLRAGYEHGFDEQQVLSELRRLVLAQLKSLNCHRAYAEPEIDALTYLVHQLQDWSRLVKLLGQVRTETMRRYHQQPSTAQAA